MGQQPRHAADAPGPKGELRLQALHGLMLAAAPPSWGATSNQ
jgi:hypothetical protein